MQGRRAFKKRVASRVGDGAWLIRPQHVRGTADSTPMTGYVLGKRAAPLVEGTAHSTPLTGYVLGKRAAPLVEGTTHSTPLTGYVLGHILRLTLTPVRRQ